MITLPSGRITEKKCREYCEQVNEELAAQGIDRRLSWQPRNGYCAVDVYKQSDRDNGGSGVERMLVGGTPRECCEEVRVFYYQEVNEKLKEPTC